MMFKKASLLASVAVIATAVTLGMSPSFAQKGGKGGGGGHDSGVTDSGHEGGKGGQQGGKGQGRSGGEGQSLKDVFKDTESGAGESSKTDEHGSSAEKGGSSTKKGGAASTRGKSGTSTTTERGQKGSAGAKKGGKTTPAASEESDSDKPAWAGTKGGKAGGNTASGTKKGDIYGDMYVLLRDENGVPILKDGFVQPLGADGQPLAVDAEGAFDSTLAIPVDLGRLSVSRASSSVLTSQLKTAVDSINAADSITLDAAGRLVLTKDGVSSAIDSPLENLALYKEILTTGTISGLTDATISKLTSSTNTTLSALGTAGVATGDLSAAASFLGAASDKTIKLTVDAVVDINTILGINTKTDTGTTYYSYSSYTFTPSTVYGTTTVDVLVKQDVTLSDNTTKTVYVPTTSNVYTTLFPTQTDTLSNIAAFTQAADDSRTIINYVHDNSIASE